MPGQLVSLVGPSGVGKTSFARRLVQECNFTLPAVAVTRAPRQDDNERYHYVSDAEFLQMAAAGSFLETDSYAGHRYGTFRESVSRILANPHFRGAVLDLTPAGCAQVKREVASALIIVLLPDDQQWLKKRLRERSTQGVHEIDQREVLLESYLRELAQIECSQVSVSFSPASWDSTFGEIVRIIEQHAAKEDTA